MGSRAPNQLQLSPLRGREAISAGLVTAAALKGPSWRRLYQGIYIEASAYRPLDHRMWCEAALVAAPRGAAIGGLSAAYLWGVDRLHPDDPVTVIVPKQHRFRDQARLRVVSGLLPRADVDRLAGFAVTTPARTAFDLGRQADRTAALVAVDAMLHRRAVTRAGLAAVADAHPGWRGVMGFRQVLASAEPGAASPMETRLRLIIIDGGLPRPVAQFEIRRDGRFVARADLAYPEWCLALEYEGDHHRDKAAYRRDIVRFKAIRAAGWAALRFTGDDVFRRSGRIVSDVAGAIADQQRRLGR